MMIIIVILLALILFAIAPEFVLGLISLAAIGVVCFGGFIFLMWFVTTAFS